MVEANIPAGETAPVATDNNASGANAPGSWETITLQERPAEIPEKFFKDGILNVKELAKSYGELEKKGAPAPAPKSNDAPAPKANEAPKVEPVKIQEPLVIPGVDAPSVAKYTDELATNGKLSDESYAALQKAGYPKTVVDAYIKGLTADQAITEAVEGARIADKQISEIQASVGGEAVMKEMLAWAVANVEPADLDAYNKAVSSPDVSQVKLAVAGMFHAFSQSQDPSLVKGYKSGEFSTVEPFISNEQVVEAMQNPKYDRDPAYREMVANRLRVSDVFRQSRDVTKESFARYQS